MRVERQFQAKQGQGMGPLTFAIFLRVARHSMDLTQEKLGKKLGLTRAIICDIEKGRQMVSTQLAVKIARKVKLPAKMALQACLQDQIRKTGVRAIVSVS